MATLSELQDLAHNNNLRGKIERAIVQKALAVTKEATPSVARLQWADDALANPASNIQLMLNYVLAENAGSTISQIISALDPAIQINIDSAVDVLHP